MSTFPDDEDTDAETLAILSDPEIMRDLAESEAAYERGEYTTAEEMDRIIRDRICGAPLALSAEDIQRFDSLPEAAGIADQAVRCELEPGHAGLHHTLVQEQADPYGVEWWARWDGQHPYEVLVLADCEAVTGSEPDTECCTLPNNHPGRHSYEFRP